MMKATEAAVAEEAMFNVSLDLTGGVFLVLNHSLQITCTK